MQVTQLNLFPLKSAQAYSVQQVFVQAQGLSFDREFMITELDGTFVTARKDKILYQFSVLPIPQGIVLCYQQTQYVVRYVDFKQMQPCEVWGEVFLSYIADTQVNHWLSGIFQREVQLRWLGVESQRQLTAMAKPMSFADSNPILLCSQKSLHQIQQWAPVEVTMAQFRANIVIDGQTAFAEELWRVIQIGEVMFEFVQHCTRCVMITRDLQTHELNPHVEPFRTLKTHHTNARGKPIFGIHLIPQNSGIVRVGDTLQVIRSEEI